MTDHDPARVARLLSALAAVGLEGTLPERAQAWAAGATDLVPGAVALAAIRELEPGALERAAPGLPPSPVTPSPGGSLAERLGGARVLAAAPAGAPADADDVLVATAPAGAGVEAVGILATPGPPPDGTAELLELATAGLADALRAVAVPDAPARPLPAGLVLLGPTGAVRQALGEADALLDRLAPGDRAAALDPRAPRADALPLEDGGWLHVSLRPLDADAALLHLRELPAGAPAIRAAASARAGFTPREAELAELAAEGRSNGEIAFALGVSENTVRSHLKTAYRKAGVAGRAQLAAYLLGVRRRRSR